MRREGHIIEEIVAYPNMSQSFDQVLRGTARKRSRQGRWLLAHREEVIAELSEKIADGSYFIEGGYRERTIIEGGKERHIQILTMKDRIACHAIMTVVDEHLKRRFIRTTGASIKERGMHDLKAYIERDLRDDPEGTRYCYMFDITKCYESTSQLLVSDATQRVFKDKKAPEHSRSLHKHDAFRDKPWSKIVTGSCQPIAVHSPRSPSQITVPGKALLPIL